MIQVTKFGARGDGRSDDTAAIQKALNEAAKSGETVYFPVGVFMVNPAKTLRVGGNTTIKGEGRSSVIRAAAGSFGWELMRVSGKDVNIAGIALDGQRRVNRVLAIAGGSARITVSGVAVQGATHSTDRRSEYYAGVVSGIVVLGNTEAVTIADSEVADVVARNLAGAGLVARGIYVTTTWGSRELAAKKITITNCYIHHIGPADDGDGIYYEDPAMEDNRGAELDSLIEGNRFDYCAKRAVKIFARGIIVRGNSINNPYLNDNYYMGTEKGRRAPDMYSAISIYGGNVTAEGNRISGRGSFYAAIEVGAGFPVEKVAIENNSITMGNNSTIKGTTAIRMGNIRDFRVVSNTIQGGERAIWTWQNAEEGRIERNVIRMLQGGGIDLTTYLRGYVQKNITCLNNQITAATFKVLTSASTNSNVVVR
ncbi:glycosyl hydrolase family 28-related protein [Paenibacillus macerans]|uniref:glycosyl hydrolase family 28-related protein n=1 Tax=Paenibacillus macerans TaxID=44252 RepID=UPI003D315C58